MYLLASPKTAHKTALMELFGVFYDLEEKLDQNEYYQGVPANLTECSNRVLVIEGQKVRPIALVSQYGGGPGGNSLQYSLDLG
jgi:hypothetical protein